MATKHYNRSIRKMVVGFGNLFKDISILRYNPDTTEQERFVVPIAYASKEDYVMRLQGDPDLNKKVQMTLPRMSFQMSGISYDASRKQNTNIKNFSQTPTGTLAQYNPVPYNFDFNLYLYIRNIEDGTQILEHIIPFFTPDYTIKLNMVPEMGITKEVPVVLNAADIPVDFEGNYERETRVIIWTLNFTVKGFIFGDIKNVSNNIILHTITNVYRKDSPNDRTTFTMDLNTGTGDYLKDELVYQGYSAATAIATAKVANWNGDQLALHDLMGNFVSTQPIIGFNSGTKYKFTSYDVTPFKYVQIDGYPDPEDATADTPYTYRVVITETNE